MAAGAGKSQCRADAPASVCCGGADAVLSRPMLMTSDTEQPSLIRWVFYCPKVGYIGWIGLIQPFSPKCQNQKKVCTSVYFYIATWQI